MIKYAGVCRRRSSVAHGLEVLSVRRIVVTSIGVPIVVIMMIVRPLATSAKIPEIPAKLMVTRMVAVRLIVMMIVILVITMIVVVMVNVMIVVEMSVIRMTWGIVSIRWESEWAKSGGSAAAATATAATTAAAMATTVRMCTGMAITRCVTAQRSISRLR